MKKTLPLALSFFIVSLTLSLFFVRMSASSEPPVLEWDRTYGGTGDEEARSLVQTVDGGYAFAGYATSFGAGDHDFWLVKIDTNGDMEWNRTYGGTGDEDALSLVQTFDEGYALAGITDSFGAGGHDFWLVKTDADGNMKWNRTYGGANHEDAYSVVQTDDEGYAIIGRTWSFAIGLYDFWLVKTDANGDMEWNKTMEGSTTIGGILLFRQPTENTQ